MKILALFVQYGQNKYPDALKKIEHLLKDICTESTFVVIDNSIETNYEEIIDGIHYINGDNTCWEFSAWDSALGRLGNNIKSFDLICFTTSALFALDTTHLQFLSYDVLEAAILRNAVVGKIDITQENMALSSVHFNRWMRTSLFFMPPKVVYELGTLTTLYSEEGIFSNDFRNPFDEQGIINDALKSKILFYLTAPQSGYHSRFDLSPTTLPFFKAKTHAILNEYALTLKIIQSDIPLMDLTQKSTYPHDDILHIVSPVIDHETYSECIQNNTYLSNENIYLCPIQNHTNNDRIPVIYNNFIRNYIRQAQGWICFCHEDLKFLASPLYFCGMMDKKCFYGVFGGRIVRNMDGKYIQDFVGKILQPNTDGNGVEQLGFDFVDQPEVDALDCVVLFVHSDLFLEYALRFDENLSFHQYVDDLCLQVKKAFDIRSRVCSIPCYHDFNAALATARLSHPDFDYMRHKWRNHAAAGTCAIYGGENDVQKGRVSILKASPSTETLYGKNRKFRPDETNVPAVLAARMMHSNCRILDVGCSCGDNGVYFKENLNAILWGFEFDADSIEKARKTEVYEAVHEMDLNLFTPHNWAAYYGYFDYVFVGDVLEHLQDPSVVLSKLKQFLKDSGAVVVSVPNIKHADVVLDLLDAHFSYYDTGILDKTHVKFFTWKSLARLFTEAHLQVVDAVPTFTLPGEMKGFVHSKALPKSLYSFVSTDRHSFVLQYVCKLEPSNEISEVTFTKCINILASSVYNNPEEYTPREHAIANFTHQKSTDFSSGDWKCVFENSIKTETLGDAILASGLFDADWYANAYPCATYANRHPLFHYIELGWQLGWNPSEMFDTNWYLHEYADALANHQCPLLHYVEKGIFEDCFVSETAKQQYEEQNKFYSPSKDDLQTTSSLYLPIIESSISGQFDTRLIAFYLPQYYPFELNNKYWGEGFTDWRNVASARPLFDGHYQPHIPIDTGHYDLRLEENALRQFELAKMYGVHGFCYYYYWFDGKRLMDMPVYRHLANTHFDFPYCLCWAPETWRTTWHNTESRIMLEQPPTIDAKRFFCDIRPFMQDERYIRVNGKPLLMIYHPTFFEKSVLTHFLETFRELAMKHGVGDLHVAFAKSYVQQAQYTTPEDLGGDAFADFPPHGATFPLDKAVNFYSPSQNDVHQVFDMRIVAEKMGLQPHYAYSHYPTVMPMWDNTARSVHSRAWTFVHASPDIYQQWLENAIRYVAEYKTCDDRIVFINAWNEWAEGAHLEPDMRYGYAFLNATRQALENSRVSR